MCIFKDLKYLPYSILDIIINYVLPNHELFDIVSYFEGLDAVNYTIFINFIETASYGFDQICENKYYKDYFLTTKKYKYVLYSYDTIGISQYEHIIALFYMQDGNYMLVIKEECSIETLKIYFCKDLIALLSFLNLENYKI
jgi:hypothetical protein